MSTTEKDLRTRYGLNSFEESVLEDERRDRLEIGAQFAPEPSRAARILNVSGRTGLPLEIIAAGESLENLEREIEKQDFNPDKWLKEAPEFAKFAAENPYNLSVLRQDEENLGYFEREWKRPIGLALQATKAKVEMNQIWNRRAQGVEHQQDGDMDRIEELQKQVQEHDYGADNWLAKALVWGAREIGPMAYITWSGKEEALLGATAGWMTGTAIGAGGGSLVAPGPGTLLGGTAGGTAGFFTGGGVGWSVGSAEASFEMMRGEQYGRYIQAGFSHEDAAAVSTWTGAISTLPELTGVGKLLRHIPGVGKFTDWTAEQVAQRVATDVLAKQSVQRATGKLIRNYGSNMGWEISTEIFQDSVASVGQNYLAAQTGNADAHITFDQYLDDVAHTAVMTAKGVMLIGAVGPGSSYVQDYRQARRSQGIEQTMTALAERLTNSKTRTEAPETYRKFVEQVTARDGGPAINANRWDEFWQGHDEDPDAMAKRFGMDAEKLKLARELDHDVEIPPVAFAEQLAPSALFDGIVQDLKWYEGDMSPRDRDLFNANKPEIVRQIEESVERLKEAESQVDAMNIIDEVTGELIAAEFDQVTARHLAQLHRGFGVIADQLDMDPQELFDRFYGGVRRVTPEALERTKVKDPMIDPLLNRLRRDDYPTERQQRGASLMDFIDEMGGLDPSDPELSAMDFELGAMDLGLSKAKMERWRKDGRLLSEIAEVASEAGYIPDYDENMLLSALSRELGGEPVFGTRETGDPGMRDIATHMDRLAEMIDGLGLDIHEMNNDQIRAALEAADTFDQEIAGDELREMIELLSKTEEREGMGGDANEIDGILGRWGSLQPLIYGEQDFGDLQITDTVTIEGIPGDVEMTEDAANKLERVQKRKTAMKKLLECVSG